LEYVIATHGDQDHIAAFVGTSTYKGVFDSFECETIIDFPKTTKTTQIYKNYVSKRNAEVAAGATHYTALQCWYETDGAQRSYTLGAGITLNILYQMYYEQTTTNENNYSVCVLISQGTNHYLFTGDLEKAGEASLIEENDLPQCKLYKAGHHGSKTSSTTALMSVIQPEIVVANCVAGGEYGFPAQEFINNIAPYTDKVYIPVMVSGSSYALMNGNIVVSSVNGQISVSCSNNNTILKETAWFKDSGRTLPSAWR
jgi:beta-lactamase superfamily II metal-dependent hydrolase